WSSDNLNHHRQQYRRRSTIHHGYHVGAAAIPRNAAERSLASDEAHDPFLLEEAYVIRTYRHHVGDTDERENVAANEQLGLDFEVQRTDWGNWVDPERRT